MFDEEPKCGASDRRHANEGDRVTKMGYLGTDRRTDGKKEQPTGGWMDRWRRESEVRDEENGWPRRCETVVMWRGRRLIKRGAAVALELDGVGKRGTTPRQMAKWKMEMGTEWTDERWRRWPRHRLALRVCPALPCPAPRAAPAPAHVGEEPGAR